MIIWETCKEIGKQPNKTFKGNFNVRVDKETHKKLFLLAAKKGLNLNQLVNKSLDFTVDNEETVLK